MSDRLWMSLERLRRPLRAPHPALRPRRLADVAARRIVGRIPLLIGASIVLLTLWLAGTVGLAATLAGALAVATVAASLPEPGEAAGSRPLEPGYGGGAIGQRSAPEAGSEPWRALLDAMPDPALVLDAASVVLRANAHARDLFPTLRHGRPISNAIRHPDLIAAVEKARTSNVPLLTHLVESFPIERRISLSVSRVALGPSPPDAPELLLTFRDLSEQDRLAQMRSDFIANASHELRTPLASLRGFVETLQGPARNDPAARERFLGLMAAQAERMTRLIDDLLSLSRVEMRVHLAPRGVVDLNEVVAHVGQSLEPIAKAAKATLEIEALDQPANVRGERDELVQVVQNLAQNALKYGFEGGRVTVRLRRLPANGSGRERVAIEVGDNGPGIPRQHLPRLTERFYRVSVSSSRDKGGTGLGLAIVKHIVTRHRGELRIDSTVGQGSTFTVVLDELPHAMR